jgi:hypothetical protein
LFNRVGKKYQEFNTYKGNIGLKLKRTYLNHVRPKIKKVTAAQVRTYLMAVQRDSALDKKDNTE